MTCNLRGSCHLTAIGTLALLPLTLHDYFLAIVFSYDKTQSLRNIFKTVYDGLRFPTGLAGGSLDCQLKQKGVGQQSFGPITIMKI